MQKRILLVENEGFMGEYLSQLLTSVGYGIDRAWNEYEAWARLADGPSAPDLVLCDMSMVSETSGLDLLRSLTALPAPYGGRRPFAFLSGRRKFELLESAARHGAAGYLIKPVEPARLLREVDALLRPRPAAVEMPRLKLLSLDESGFRIALPFHGFLGARAQLYNLILEEFRMVPPRFQLLEAEHDPLDSLSYLVKGIFQGPVHGVESLKEAWGRGRQYGHGA